MTGFRTSAVQVAMRTHRCPERLVRCEVLLLLVRLTAESQSKLDVASPGPPGVDLPREVIRDVAAYVRLTAIPPRGAGDVRGGAVFESVGCAVCHAPALRTRVDYPVASLAGIDAAVFTDLLLHDMGDENADGIEEESASSREWRTAPLIGIAFLKSYLHDGRALDVDAAVEGHDGRGSEARGVVQAWRALSREDRAALRRFVESL